MAEYFDSSLGINTKNHILGDGAFPLKTWLMKPYIGRNLNPIQQNFNFRLSSTRMVVENTFGRYKGRFRVVSKRMDFSLDNSRKIIKTTMTLHNICEQNKCTFHDSWTENLHIIDVPQRNMVDVQTSNATAKRDRLAMELHRAADPLNV